MTNERPAAARRRRRPITGRALILGAVLVLLVVLLAAPLHRFLTARSAVAASVTAQHNGERQLKALEQLNQQLSDPAYVEAQARVRLQYALPGDTVYQIVQPGQKVTIDAPTGKGTTATTIAGDTWNERLWGSLSSADHSPP